MWPLLRTANDSEWLHRKHGTVLKQLFNNQTRSRSRKERRLDVRGVDDPRLTHPPDRHWFQRRSGRSRLLWPYTMILPSARIAYALSIYRVRHNPALARARPVPPETCILTRCTKITPRSEIFRSCGRTVSAKVALAVASVTKMTQQEKAVCRARSRPPGTRAFCSRFRPCVWHG